MFSTIFLFPYLCKTKYKQTTNKIMPIVAPSILAADFGNLAKDIEMVNNSQAEWFHLDVMDGVFVPNISYGMPIIEKINSLTDKVLDVHLMIVGADILTVHYEACTHFHRTLQAIKAEGMKAGVALNPHTPVSVLEDVINDLDLVLIMSVNPGFGGQKFIENTYNKVSKLKKMITDAGADVIIEIDGGVGIHNASKLVEAGADALVAGSAVFNAENPTDYIAELKKA